MREAAGIWPKPIVDRWASLADVARDAARLVGGRDVGSPRARAARVEGLRHLVFVWKFSILLVMNTQEKLRHAFAQLKDGTFLQPDAAR